MNSMNSKIQAILIANRNFYDAFAEGSMDKMDKIWSSSEKISCIHPGWPPLFGQEDVIDSWHCILEASPTLVNFSKESAHIHGQVGYVICYEHLEPGTLLATNIFANENNEWKMIHHQSSIVPSNRDDEGFDELDDFENFDALDGPTTIQ